MMISEYEIEIEFKPGARPGKRRKMNKRKLAEEEEREQRRVFARSIGRTNAEIEEIEEASSTQEIPYCLICGCEVDNDEICTCDCYPSLSAREIVILSRVKD
jgi:hypothetical protein